jgi:hypothetical protein
MSWYRVTFDLDNDQPPGIEPQIAFALEVQRVYNALGCPNGFAVYDLSDFEHMLYSFFFSPLAAEHFADYINSNRHEIWDKPLPDGANLTIGDSTVAP